MRGLMIPNEPGSITLHGSRLSENGGYHNSTESPKISPSVPAPENIQVLSFLYIGNV